MRAAPGVLAMAVAGFAGTGWACSCYESKYAAPPDAIADDPGSAPDASADEPFDEADTALDFGTDGHGADGDAVLDARTDVDDAGGDGADGETTRDAGSDAVDEGGGDGFDAPIECAAPLAPCLDGDGVHRCVDLQREHCHCGACGNRCMGGPCSAGRCTECAEEGYCTALWCTPHLTDPECISGATDVATLTCTNARSPENCCACGLACDVPHAIPACDGLCGVGRCDPGWGDCDGLGLDGCEVDLSGSSSNCGSCGFVCPSSMPMCVDGICAL